MEQPVKSVSHLMCAASVATIAVGLAAPVIAQSNVEQSTAPLDGSPGVTLSSFAQ